MKMKIYILYIAGALIASAGACKSTDDFLDKTETTNLNEQTTFADSARTLQFLTRVYADIGVSEAPDRFTNGGSLNVISDESESVAVGGNQWNIRFQTGNVSALQIPTDAWDIPYQNIRRVNVFLSHLPETPLSPALQRTLGGEARFLRAWYYFVLLKHYGGIPMVGDQVFEASDELPGKRNTFEECVSYIDAELLAAADMLPPRRTGLDYGRISRGACQALRSRVLLYAASPLFNGRTDQEGALAGVLGYPAPDRARWEKAAQAAQDVINLGVYTLHEENDPARPGYGFQALFPMRVNQEYILALMQSNNRSLETWWDPPSRTGGGGAFPYQELVDAFGTINGKPIDEDVKSSDNPRGYDENDPYANRDPRLGYTVLFNGAMRLNTSRTITPVYTHIGDAVDGFTTATGARTKTGYYTRKMLSDETIRHTSSPVNGRCFPLIRYAEVLLNRAEALNELLDAPSTDVFELVMQIRRRAGILAGTDNLYGLKDGMSKEEMREVIYNERRVELAFEGHRYWDVRRWRIAEHVSNRPLHGMRITPSGNAYTYEKVVIRTPVFAAPRWYLWPIPQSEINKSMDLHQNPGW